MNVISLRNGTLGLCLLLNFATTEARADGPETNSAPPSGYKLVWADEFSKDPDGLPDPTKWIYEEGFKRNRESQYYTKERLENARVEKGQLIIEGRKEEYTDPAVTPPVSAHYTAASLQTIGKADWTYGRIEVRAKLPTGNGVWPAIWMLGTDVKDKSVGWPKCGEIDILELVGHQPGIVHGTIHYFANGKHRQQGAQTQVSDSDTNFHVYAAEWTPDHIDIFADNKKYNSFAVSKADNDGQNPFHKPQFLILNLALGGSWGGKIDDSIFPQRMTVDYVRIYQKTAP